MTSTVSARPARTSSILTLSPFLRPSTAARRSSLVRIFRPLTAVMMSQHGLASGLFEHDEVAVLAADIRDDQRVEIVRMRGWLHDWFGTRWMH